MESITGRPWGGGDVNTWLLPYTGSAQDPKMVARFETLGRLPSDSFGHAFWTQFKKNGYTFPGDPKGLNATFTVPHDAAHVLTGYDTTPRGEILVSTFTAAMHPKHPMSGHVLPVIFSWHLKVMINKVAGDAAGALDPAEFWHAWAGGAAAKVDTFAPDWDFWAHVETPLRALRESWSIPIEGLERRAS
jgi:ubiquinone biosynthesis protein Coq4